MALAQRRTGLSDFGAPSVEAALDRLQLAVHAEADLNLFGRLSRAWDDLRLLKNLLILRDKETADPRILQRPLGRPLFIMGVPRSGTSFLHALLAEDDANLVPRCWEVIYPYPDHAAAGRHAGPDLVQRQFNFFHWLAPDVRSLHPFEARTPQECTDITAHSFQSLRFDTTFHVPSYKTWLQETGHTAAYHFHRRFLQHLQGDRAGRWVLKSPDHVFAMDALRDVYPDACIVFVHRDPLKVLASVARLTEALRRPFARRVDRLGVGRQVAADWALGAQKMIGADAQPLWPAKQVMHLHYLSLTSDPVGSLERLYEHFDMEFSPSFRNRIAASVEAKPRGGYGHNVHKLEDYGLSAGVERERYRAYMSRFDVEQEFAA
jgi:hypothetical protein